MAANNSYQESVALIAAANRVVQDPNSVGAALRTISLRLRGTSTEELEEAGEDTEGVITSKSKLRSKIKGYTGIDILTDSGAYKSTYEILLEISKVWDDLTDMDRAGLLEMIAGKTRSNTAAAILSNTKDLEEAYKSAMEAEGSALAENEKYLDSIQGRIDLFNNSVQTMWNNALDDDFIKGLITVGTELIKIIDNVGLLKSLLIAIGTFAGVKYFNGNLLGGLFGGIFANKESYTMPQIKKRLSDLQKMMNDAKTELDASPADKSRQKKYNRAEKVYNKYKKQVLPQIKEYDDLITRQQQAQNNFNQANHEFIQATRNGADPTTIEAYGNRVRQAKVELEQVNTEVKNFKVTTSDTIPLTQKLWSGIKTGAKTALKSIGKVGQAFLESYVTMQAMTLLFKGFDLLFSKIGSAGPKSAEKTMEEFKELNSELDNAKSNLKTLEGELDTVQDRIDELMDKGSLSFVEQEELDTLRAQSEELKTQISLAKTLKENLQISVNNASINAIGKYLKETSFSSTDSQSQRVEEAGSMGQSLGTTIGYGIGKASVPLITKGAQAAGSAIGGKIGGALGSVAPGIGNIIGMAAGTLIGGAVGKAIGTFSSKKEYEKEQTVQEALNNMKAERAKLQQAQVDAYKAYADNPLEDELVEKFNNASDELAIYDKNMAKHIQTIQEAYNAIDISSLDLTNDSDKALLAYKRTIGDILDKYNIVMGGDEAKSNTIARIFGDEAEGGFANVKKQAEAAVEDVKTLRETLVRLGKDGSVDLTIRPKVDASEMQKAGWNVKDGSISTVDTSTYSNKDGSIAMNFTPILPNGEVLTPTELQEYAEAVIAGTREDDLGLKVGATFSGEDAIDQAVNVAQTIHELHEKYFLDSAVNLDVLSDAEISRLRKLGIYIHEVKDYFDNVIEVESEFVDSGLDDVAKDIDKITDGIGELKSAFDEVIEKGVLSAKTVISLKDALKIDQYKDIDGVTEAWNDYLKTMMSGVSTTQEMTTKTESLTQAILKAALAENNLTPDNKLEYVAQLRQLNIKNADQVVDNFLQNNMSKELKQKTDIKKAAYDEYAKNIYGPTKAFEELTDDEINKIISQYGSLIEVSDDVKNDIIERYDVEADAVDSIIEKLKEKAKKEVELANLENKRSSHNELSSSLNDINEDVLAYEEFSEKYGAMLDIMPTGSAKNAWTMLKGKNGLLEEDREQFIEDYEHLREVFGASGSYQDLLNKKQELEKQLLELDFNSDNYKQVKAGLEDEIKKLENSFDIDMKVKVELQNKSDLVDQMQEVYDTLAEAEKEYNENGGYVSVDTLQSLLQLEPKYLAMLYDENGQLKLNKETLLQVAQARTLDMGIQAAQNVITAASDALDKNKIDRLHELTQVTYNQADANWALVDSNLAVLKSTIEKRNADTADVMYGQLGGVYESIASQVYAIKDMTNRSVANISKSFSSASKSDSGSADDAFQKAMDYWENRIGANQARYDQIQNEIDLLEKKGKIAGKEYYEEQIKLENERLKLLEAQKAEAKNFLGTFKEGSDEWWEVANTLNDIEGDIDDVTSSIQDLRDAMAEVDWQIFEETHERFDDLIGQLDTIRELLSADEDTFFDDAGQWTEDGVAVLATHIQQLEIYKDALTRVNTELEKFKNPYAGNEAYYATMGIDSEQEYYDRLKQLTDEQYDYATAVSDTEQSVVDMYESQIDAIEEYTNELVEAYNDYIDVVKEALDAERDLYEFKKDIQKQTRDIASLERRIASLSGSDNASDIAERRKLEAELYDAKEGLNDTYYDHAKDSQNKALDDESTAYEESMNNYVEKLRTTLDEAKLNTDLFIEQVTLAVMTNADTILTKYGETGVQMSSALTKPWQDAADKIAAFGGTEGALAAMNSWTKAGANGFVYNFSVNATSQLKSPWDSGASAAKGFQTSVSGVMSNVVSNITSNVATAKSQLSSLYSQIQDTNIKLSSVNTGSSNVAPKTSTLSSSDVSALQKVLSNVFHQVVTIDGKFGPQTEKALIAAQKMMKNAGISVSTNGKYTSATKNAMVEYINKEINKLKTYGGSSIYGQAIKMFTEHKNMLPAAFHAKGTLGTKRDELAITDESWIGEEITLAAGKNGQLQYLKKGSAVMPADISANLVEWGKLNPKMMTAGVGANVNMISNAINKPEFKLDIENFLRCDNVSQDTLPELKRFVSEQMNSLMKQLNYGLKKAGAR